MPIVPEFLLAILQTHLAVLEVWFSQRLYAHLTKNAPHHLLVCCARSSKQRLRSPPSSSRSWI